MTPTKFDWRTGKKVNQTYENPIELLFEFEVYVLYLKSKNLMILHLTIFLINKNKVKHETLTTKRNNSIIHICIHIQKH